MIKAAHVRKVRDRAERFKGMMGVTPDTDEQEWRSRWDRALAQVRSDPEWMGLTRAKRRNARQAFAFDLWRIITHDLLEMCDALLEEKRENQRLRQVIVSNGLSIRPAGDDGLTDEERAEYAQRFWETAGANLSPEDVTRLRESA